MVPSVIGKKSRLARANSMMPAPRARRPPGLGGPERTRLIHRFSIAVTPGEGHVQSQAKRPELWAHPDGSRAPGEATPGGIFRRYHRLAPAAVRSDPMDLHRLRPPARSTRVRVSRAPLFRRIGMVAIHPRPS